MKKTHSLLIAFALLMGIPTISSMERSASQEAHINAIVEDLLYKPTAEGIQKERNAKILNNYKQLQELIQNESKSARSCYKTISKWIQKGRDIEETMDFLIVLPRKESTLARKIVRIAYLLILGLSPEQQDYFIGMLYENPSLTWNKPSPYQLATQHTTITKFVADHELNEVHKELVTIMAEKDSSQVKIFFDNLTNISKFKKLVLKKEDAIDYSAWNQNGHTLLTCLYNSKHDEKTITDVIELFNSLTDFHKLLKPLFKTPSRLGLTPLHYAAYHGHLKVAKQLLIHRADAKAVSRKPVYFYLSEDKETITDHYNEIQTPLEEYDGITPLHCAALSTSNTQPMISLLTIFGADKTLADSSGKRAIDYLSESDRAKNNVWVQLLK